MRSVPEVVFAVAGTSNDADELVRGLVKRAILPITVPLLEKESLYR